jgi:predicted neutral ceramidase superfamily lipid hydrolase
MLQKLFSSQYINQGAAKNNIVIYLIGRLSYPFTVLLVKIGFSPNQITTLSIIFAIFASASLIFDSGWTWFLLCWTISLLLDFCDGTAARMTGQVRRTAFRYDHTSDLFKIFIVILGVAIRFDDVWVWIIALSVVFFVMYYTVLNHDASSSSKITFLSKSECNGNQDEANCSKNRKLTLKEKIKNNIQDGIVKDIFYNLYTIVFSINGHTLLLFLLFAFGKNMVISVLFYLTLLSVIGVWKNINILRAIKKIES